LKALLETRKPRWKKKDISFVVAACALAAGAIPRAEEEDVMDRVAMRISRTKSAIAKLAEENWANSAEAAREEELQPSVFNDVTVGTNAVPCVTGTPNCVANPSTAGYGVVSTGTPSTPAFAAGPGLRISEALGLEVGKHLSKDCSIITINQQRGKKGQTEAYPKTDAGVREVDVDPSLAKMLRDFLGDRKQGFLFESENGTMLNPQNIYRDALSGILKGMGRSNVRYHAFRRFRESILLRSECRNILINFWHGHADSEMSSRYGKQLLEDVEFRQEWAKKIGLGFDLPTANPDLVGLRGLQIAENPHHTEAA
jgi:hypothetical protein